MADTFRPIGADAAALLARIAAKNGFDLPPGLPCSLPGGAAVEGRDAPSRPAGENAA